MRLIRKILAWIIVIIVLLFVLDGIRSFGMPEFNLKDGLSTPNQGAIEPFFTKPIYKLLKMLPRSITGGVVAHLVTTWTYFGIAIALGLIAAVISPETIGGVIENVVEVVGDVGEAIVDTGVAIVGGVVSGVASGGAGILVILLIVAAFFYFRKNKE